MYPKKIVLGIYEFNYAAYSSVFHPKEPFWKYFFGPSVSSEGTRNTCLSWPDRVWTLCRCVMQRANRQHVLHTSSKSGSGWTFSVLPDTLFGLLLTNEPECEVLQLQYLSTAALKGLTAAQGRTPQSLLDVASGGGLTGCVRQLNCGGDVQHVSAGTQSLSVGRKFAANGLLAGIKGGLNMEYSSHRSLDSAVVA